jgi:hypothetical protein
MTTRKAPEIYGCIASLAPPFDAGKTQVRSAGHPDNRLEQRSSALIIASVALTVML